MQALAKATALAGHGALIEGVGFRMITLKMVSLLGCAGGQGAGLRSGVPRPLAGEKARHCLL